MLHTYWPDLILSFIRRETVTFLMYLRGIQFSVSLIGEQKLEVSLCE